MMSRGFKPVGWVAGVAAAAISCYMLSLNVASERAELAKIERGIIMAKKDIRSLQTELGTRGRLQQLENWNANVLALSAPKSAQFLDDAVTLARFEQPEKTLEERAVVQMAAAETATPQPQVSAPVRYAAAPAAPVREVSPLVHRASVVVAEAKPAAPQAKPAAAEAKPLAAQVKTASAETKASLPVKKASAEAKAPLPVKKASAEAKAPLPVKKAAAEAKAPAAAKKAATIDDDLVKSIGDAAKAEKSGSAGGQ